MRKQPVFLEYKLHHVLGWAIVFAFWYFLRYEDYSTPREALLVTLVKVTDLALLVYITNYVLLPRLLYKKKYGWFVLAFVTMVITSSFLKMQLLGQFMHNPAMFDLSRNLKSRFYDNVLPHFFLVMAGAAIKLIYDHSKMQQRLAEMAKEKAEAELSFLKSQINPHFLFNSLNSVYFLIDKENSEARRALHKFSDMLRYQLYEMAGDKIPVEKEVAYLKDYVDLQKLRTDENYQVEFSCDQNVKGFLIEPLLLIPFVENAFKHISHSTAGNNYVKLDMARNNGHFHFTIENSKEEERAISRPGGIGLANVKRRLELLYPGKHELIIEDNPNRYKVNLTLKTDT